MHNLATLKSSCSNHIQVCNSILYHLCAMYYQAVDMKCIFCITALISEVLMSEKNLNFTTKPQRVWTLLNDRAVFSPDMHWEGGEWEAKVPHERYTAVSSLTSQRHDSPARLFSTGSQVKPVMWNEPPPETCRSHSKPFPFWELEWILFVSSDCGFILEIKRE